MKKIIALMLAASLGLSACAQGPSQRTVDTVGTGVAGGAIAAIAATALDASTGWTVAAGLAGAAAGALYARNKETNQCAYHTGDGETVNVTSCK